MCDDFPPDGITADRAQAQTAQAVGVGAFDVGLSSLGVEGCDALDQCPVELVIENDIVPNFESIQKEGDRGEYHEVPFLKVRQHRVASDFENAEHLRC